MGHDLYAAVVTSVPFLLLVLVADTKVFGPVPSEDRGGWDLALDVVMLSTLAISFFASLVGLAMEDPPDLRVWAGVGLGLGAMGVFIHAFVGVFALYRTEESDGEADAG